jgi:DNA mismatch endonuclease (patch repair protein)
MVSNRSRDTGPERALRSALWARGLRYRVARRPLRDARWTADLVFGPSRVAVFVDGCFWHGCPEHGRTPTANRAYWGPKLAKNRERDKAFDRLLAEHGWLVVRVFEHESVGEAAEMVAAVVARRRTRRSLTTTGTGAQWS